MRPPLDRSALWLPDVGYCWEEIQSFLPVQAERSRLASVSMTKADRQRALMHKTWAGKVWFDHQLSFFFLFFSAETWEAATACLNQHEGNAMLMRSSHLHTTNRVKDGTSTASIQPEENPSQVTIFTELRLCEAALTLKQTRLDGRVVKLLCTAQWSNSYVRTQTGPRSCFGSNHVGLICEGNLWHRFPGPGFDVQIGTFAKSVRRGNNSQKMWHRGRIPKTSH